MFEGCGGKVQVGMIQFGFLLFNWESVLCVMDILDVYIILFWSLLEECFRDKLDKCKFYLDGVLVEFFVEGECIYFDVIFDVNGLFMDSYCYFVGLDSMVSYILNFFVRGSGMMVCNSFLVVGSMIFFKLLVSLVVLDGIFFGEVQISW